MRLVSAVLISCVVVSATDASGQTRRTPARRPAPVPPTVEVPEMNCPTPLGVGVTTKRTFCDVLTGRETVAAYEAALR